MQRMLIVSFLVEALGWQGIYRTRSSCPDKKPVALQVPILSAHYHHDAGLRALSFGLRAIKNCHKTLPFTLHMAGLKMQLHDFGFINYAVLFGYLAGIYSWEFISLMQKQWMIIFVGGRVLVGLQGFCFETTLVLLLLCRSQQKLIPPTGLLLSGNIYYRYFAISFLFYIPFFGN